MNPIPLPRWARISIALACVAIGLASSTVAGSLLVRGLELTEPDGTARAILTAAGVLMIVTELVAFFLVALLPTARLHQLRLMGMALLAFEVITIFGTRLVLNHGAESQATAQAMRMENLRLAIATRTADADRVRANGQRQSTSDNAWVRHLGSQAIQRASSMERDIEPLRDELADMQSRLRPTLPSALGPGLALAHSIAMPVLVSSIGLTLFGVAGLMLRRPGLNGGAVRQQEQPAVAGLECGPPEREAGRSIEVDRTRSVAPEIPQSQPVQSVQPVPMHRTAVPAGAVPAVPSAVSTLTAWRSIAAALPLSALPATPAVLVSPAPVDGPSETVPLSEPAPGAPATVQPVEGAVTAEDDRYQRLRAGVLAGQIKPSVRALREAGGGGTDTVRRYLQQLAAEGVITKEGQGYSLASQ
jgi:hypothetical protein